MQEELQIRVVFTFTGNAADSAEKQRAGIVSYLDRSLSEGWREYGVDMVEAKLGRLIPESEIYGTNGQPDPLETMDPETVALAAATLWEAVLNADPTRQTPNESAPAWVQALRVISGNIGAAELRATVCGFAASVERGFTVAQGAGFDLPFDWEFVPWFLATCLDWDESAGVSLRLEYLNLCHAYGAAT